MQRFDNERALMDDFLGITKPAPPPVVDDEDKSWVDDYVQRADAAMTKQQRRRRTRPKPPPSEPVEYDYDAKAEEIARLFEDPVRTPNLVLFRQPDDPFPREEWRKAAHRAGNLLGRKVTVFTTGMRRLVAQLEQTEEELEAERHRLTEVMDAVLTGSPKPPPLPRTWRS